MEFRVYFHLSSFFLDRRSPRTSIAILAKLVEYIDSFCSSTDDYNRFGLSSKIYYHSDLNVSEVISANGESLISYGIKNYGYEYIERTILRILPIDDGSKLTSVDSSYSLSGIDTTNTIFSEMYEFNDGVNKFSWSICSKTCTVANIGTNLVDKNREHFKDTEHLQLLAENTVQYVQKLFNTYIYHWGTNSVPDPKQTFLRDTYRYKMKRAADGHMRHYDGYHFYKVDMTHKNGQAHVEKSVTGSFSDNDRFPRNIYVDKPHRDPDRKT